MDRELLIEIGCEEIPASWLAGLTQQVATHLDARLREARLETDAPAESYSTPRRLTARVAKLAERQTDHEELATGPPVSAAYTPDGEPTPAAIGFAKKYGINYVSVRDGGGSILGRYGVTGFPETYFLDARGRIVVHNAGEVSRSEIEEGIAQARES